MKGAIIAVAAAFVAVIALVSCSSTSPGPDEMALQYEGGPFSSQEFDHCVDPGTKSWDGPGDEYYTYPAGQRTATFGSDGSELGEISIVSQDTVTMGVSGIITFALNTDCDTLVQFHETVANKYRERYGDEWWTHLLQDYLGQALNQSLDTGSKDYGWRPLYTATVKAPWEAKVGEQFTSALNELSGGDYFCQPTYNPESEGVDGECGDPVLTLQKPSVPTEIEEAQTAKQEAIELNAAAKEQQAVQATEGQSLRKGIVQAGLARPGQPITSAMLDAYTRWLAVHEGKAQIYVLPEGSSIIANQGAPTAAPSE